MTLLRGWAVLSVELTPAPRASRMEKTHCDYRSKLDTGELKQRINSFQIPPQQILGEEETTPSARPSMRSPWEGVTRTSSLWLFGLPSLANERTATWLNNIPSHSAGMWAAGLCSQLSEMVVIWISEILYLFSKSRLETPVLPFPSC